MALRKVVTVEEESLLRRKSKEVKIFDEKLKELISDMIETMKNEDGMGLAAPQIGILKRVVVCVLEGKVTELVNPEIVKQQGEVVDIEGCLSVPGKRGNVKRPAFVAVKALNSDGKPIKVKGTDYNARVLCHEIDHLNGILYTDKAENIHNI